MRLINIARRTWEVQYGYTGMIPLGRPADPDEGVNAD